MTTAVRPPCPQPGPWDRTSGAVGHAMPAIAAIATAIAGFVNIVSVLTPAFAERVRGLMALGALQEVTVANALALPAGVALLASALPLARRKRRAWRASISLLLILGLLNLVKGIDIEEAAICWALALGLWYARDAFYVRQDRAGLPRAIARAATLAALSTATATAAVFAAGDHITPDAPMSHAMSRALRFLILDGSAVDVARPFAWLPAALGVLGIGTLLTMGALLLGPARPKGPQDADERLRAEGLVRLHGTDTLSAFKLRADLERLWSADHRAFVGYRIEAGTLLVAGDPVGPDDALPDLLDELVSFARDHGLALGGVGASEDFAAQMCDLGLQRLYLGDEAMICTGTMDLSGGKNKSLRKAVNRIARNGFTADVCASGELTAADRAALEAVSEQWRDGADERGFSMSHDALTDDLIPDALVVLARDDAGVVRGFLQFVPVFDRPIMSLAFMRRDRDTPNGLTDFLVVEAARLLGERGIDEFSLNFSAFGRWLRAPTSLLERGLARLLVIGDRWFQVERLLSFNQKFHPRWQPRYLLFDRASGLPRLALAALLAEGQMPTFRRSRKPAEAETTSLGQT